MAKFWKEGEQVQEDEVGWRLVFELVRLLQRLIPEWEKSTGGFDTSVHPELIGFHFIIVGDAIKPIPVYKTDAGIRAVDHRDGSYTDQEISVTNVYSVTFRT